MSDTTFLLFLLGPAEQSYTDYGANCQTFSMKVNYNSSCTSMTLDSNKLAALVPPNPLALFQLPLATQLLGGFALRVCNQKSGHCRAIEDHVTNQENQNNGDPARQIKNYIDGLGPDINAGERADFVCVCLPWTLIHSSVLQNMTASSIDTLDNKYTSRHSPRGIINECHTNQQKSISCGSLSALFSDYSRLTTALPKCCWFHTNSYASLSFSRENP